jgi:hypothetical protein
VQVNLNCHFEMCFARLIISRNVPRTFGQDMQVRLMWGCEPLVEQRTLRLIGDCESRVDKHTTTMVHTNTIAVAVASDVAAAAAAVTADVDAAVDDAVAAAAATMSGC